MWLHYTSGLPLVLTANGRGTDAGCLFRKESPLIFRNVHQDLGKLKMTIFCQEIPSPSSSSHPHLAELRKTVLTVLSFQIQHLY